MSFAVIATYIPLILLLTIVNPPLLVVLTSILAWYSMREYVLLRSMILTKSTIRIHYKKVTVEDSITGESSREISSDVTMEDKEHNHPIMFTSGYDQLQMYIRCLMALAFSLIGFGLWITKNLHSPFIQMTTYTAASISLFGILVFGHMFRLLDAGELDGYEEEYRKDDILSIAMDFVAILCIGGGLSLLFSMAQISTSYTLLFLTSMWIGKLAAKVFDSFYQGNIVFQSISPSSTLESVFAAILGSSLFGFFFKLLSSPITWLLGHGTDMFWTQSHFTFAVVGGIIAAFSTVGHLGVEYLKRFAGVRKSGDLFFDHGGCLDVLDSALCAAPFMYVALPSVFA